METDAELTQRHTALRARYNRLVRIVAKARGLDTLSGRWDALSADEREELEELSRDMRAAVHADPDVLRADLPVVA